MSNNSSNTFDPFSAMGIVGSCSSIVGLVAVGAAMYGIGKENPDKKSLKFQVSFGWVLTGIALYIVGLGVQLLFD